MESVMTQLNGTVCDIPYNQLQTWTDILQLITGLLARCCLLCRCFLLHQH